VPLTARRAASASSWRPLLTPPPPVHGQYKEMHEPLWRHRRGPQPGLVSFCHENGHLRLRQCALPPLPYRSVGNGYSSGGKMCPSAATDAARWIPTRASTSPSLAYRVDGCISRRTDSRSSGCMIASLPATTDRRARHLVDYRLPRAPRRLDASPSFDDEEDRWGSLSRVKRPAFLKRCNGVTSRGHSGYP
jgi:hypothetical protein